LIAALLLFGGLLNLASSGPWERFGWAPLAFVLAALVFRLTGSHAMRLGAAR
jgi:hypothetical protein